VEYLASCIAAGGEPDMDGSRASRRGKNGRAVEGLGGDEGRRGWPFSFYY
jgi:hypothetical protein